MSYHPRIETEAFTNFLTTRTINSQLWFINNRRLEEAILGAAAKCNERYGASFYALAIEGSHIHSLGNFVGPTRASYMRDFNSAVAKAVDRHVSEFRGGKLFGRRYSQEFVLDNESIERMFFYTVLQPVQDGLVEKISEYPGYNCFHDAIWGIKRKYKVINWLKYNEAKRRRTKTPVHMKDFVEEYTLEYERLPGYEGLSQKEYALHMQKRLEEERQKVLQKRREEAEEEGKVYGFVGREALMQMKPGSYAKNPKTSDMNSTRVRAIGSDPKLFHEVMEWYFDIYYRYKEASRRYRAGELDVEFPPGTYRPHLHHGACAPY